MMKRTMMLSIAFGLLAASTLQPGAVGSSANPSPSTAPAVAEVGWAVSHWDETLGAVTGALAATEFVLEGLKIGARVGGWFGGLAGAVFGGAVGAF